MGNMKYPIGIQSFEKIITEGYLYIDKTQMIYDMVENGKIYFLSRPRRFGKSLLVSTLECYFQGRKELFKGLAIDHLETDWKQYAVFHLDFNGKDFTQAGQLEKTLIDFVESQEAIYGKAPFASTLGDRFIGVLRNAHEKTGLRAVVLIDEYDKPLLDVLDSTLKTTDADGNERLICFHTGSPWLMARLLVGQFCSHNPQCRHFSLLTLNGLSVIIHLLKKPPITFDSSHGRFPFTRISRPSSLPIMTGRISARNRAASSIFLFSFSGVSVNIPGRHTYDSGMMTENTLFA